MSETHIKVTRTIIFTAMIPLTAYPGMSAEDACAMERGMGDASVIEELANAEDDQITIINSVRAVEV